MPPSDQLEEIGALATLIDENRFSYSLDALCACATACPARTTTLLRGGGRGRGLQGQQEEPSCNRTSGNCRRALSAPTPRPIAVATLALFENLNPILDQRRHPRRLSARSRSAADGASRCAAAAFALIRAPPNRRATTACRNAIAALAELSEQLGSPRRAWHEIASPKWKARTFDAHGINYPRTEKGNPSFKAGKLGWMAKHPALAAAADRDRQQIRRTPAAHFSKATSSSHLIGDRIYAEINPFRSEDGGTKSFRFSYSNPPLQQMPSRDKELGPLIRSVFLPEEGEVWCKPDISQQEFRFVVHHAVLRNLPGAKEAAEHYRNNPDADFHAIVAEMTGLDRDMAEGRQLRQDLRRRRRRNSPR